MNQTGHIQGYIYVCMYMCAILLRSYKIYNQKNDKLGLSRECLRPFIAPTNRHQRRLMQETRNPPGVRGGNRSRTNGCRGACFSGTRRRPPGPGEVIMHVPAHHIETSRCAARPPLRRRRRPRYCSSRSPPPMRPRTQGHIFVHCTY